jgi:S1-C subfamily serine protease
MELKKSHKVLIGSFTSLVVLFIIFSSIFMYSIFIKQNKDYETLNKKIDINQEDSQIKFNELSNSLIEIKEGLNSLDSQIGSLDEEFTRLKASTSADFSGIVENAIKSVVTIKTNLAQGSGFVISEEGYIVTNEHVMSGATAALITTYDGKNHQVIKIGENIEMDITLLKIISTDYPYLQLENSNNVQVGEKVISIGNPLGLQFSVSEGIISGIHREGENGLSAYLQTDASLNSGNSGGPLINKNGKVVGINNFKIVGSENLGFALESNYLKSVINDIARQSSIGIDLI